MRKNLALHSVSFRRLLGLAVRWPLEDRSNSRSASEDIDALLDAHVDDPERLEKLRRFGIATRLTALAGDNSFEKVERYFSKAHGQLLQDLFAAVATDWKRGGTFVEVGVGNGLDLSNTYLLEKSFGWKGVLVDPDPRFHGSIA